MSKPPSGNGKFIITACQRNCWKRRMDFEFEKVNPIGNWFHETCTIFRIGIVRLGVTQLFCCVVSAGLGGVFMWLNQGNAWAGMGCWLSLAFLISGCWNLVNRRGRPRNKFSPCTIFNFISLLCASFLFLYSAFLLDSVIINNERPFPQYRYNITTEPGPLIGVQSGLLIMSILEFIAATWSASLSVGLICLCCQLKDSVFTIPYQDMDDGLPHGPDIVPGHSILDSDPSGPDIVPSYSPAATPLAAAKRYQPPGPLPALELEWDNFVGGEITSDLENSTGFGEPGGTSVQYEDDYFGSSADM